MRLVKKISDEFVYDNHLFLATSKLFINVNDALIQLYSLNQRLDLFIPF